MMTCCQAGISFAQPDALRGRGTSVRMRQAELR